MNKPIRVIIADDHEMVRAGLAQFITDYEDITIVAEAKTGDEALRLARFVEADVLLLDIAMPNKNGIDCLRILRKAKPELAILVMSGFPEDQYAVNVLRSGASGYISKSASP